MKCTPSGHKWAHVSCVLWIPEVSIGCAEKMEPITKITSIPASRWSLVCVLCRERKGACIQCSVKTCKTAYHVTCAFKHGLEMRAIIEDENADDGVKLRSYCQKHSVNSKKEKCPGSGSEEEEVKRKRRKDMTSEEKTQARAARLQEIEGEFDRHVTVKDISTHLLDIDQDAIHYIYNYWKLKRRAGYNRPLLPPKSDDHELLTHRQEQADLDKMKMFVQLRQDLERVRNLCYMVSRREKLSRTFFRMREQTFHKQIAVLTEDPTLSGPDLAAILQANHGPSIYDRLYSHPNAPDHKNDFDDLLARIAPQDSSDDKKKDRNGLVRGSKSANPYKKHYVNGARRSGSMYSGYSSEESGGDVSRSTKYRGKVIGSTTEDDVKKSGSSPKKKVSPKGKGKKSPKKVERKKRKVPQSKAVVESSSEDDTLKSRMKKDRSRSKTLQQMEKEMTAGKTGQSGTDSDDLIPIRTTRNSKFPMDIYSDSSDEVSIKEEIKPGKSTKAKNEKSKSEKSKAGKSCNDNDSQQPLPRTKAAMKEFIPTQPEKKTVPVPEKPAPKKRGRKPSNKEKKTPVKTKPSDDEAKNKENIKLAKQKDNPTDLIVPQRQAAKKASENMRSTTAVKKEDTTTDKQVSGDDAKSKPKLKSKGKEVKDIPRKVGRKKSSKDQDKELIAYVPQRQAAKKAAAHIKSGLGTKAPVTETIDTDKKKDIEKVDTKTSPKKDDPKRSKSPQKESSSSSSNSSSSSYSSSSSSEEEQEKHEIKPTAKAREIKPAPRQPSMFSPPGSRPTVDLPFLDKVSRPLSSTSASSDTDSSKASRLSESGSPSPKRPRRRRKRKSVSVDASLRKAPDKKLKTSDQGSECRVPSPAIEGEEPSRPSDTRASTRARTRSTTSSGNMPHKSDARQRKPSKDDTGHASAPNKISKESSQPIELKTTKRKEDEEIKKETDVNLPIEVTNNDIQVIKPIKTKGRSVSIEEKVKPNLSETTPLKRTSPRKSTETKHKIAVQRRMSVKDASIKEILSPPKETCAQVPKGRNSTRRTSQATELANVSPVKKVTESIDAAPMDSIENKPVIEEVDFPDNDKNWLPKAPSPNVHPPPVEKPGDHEKYMTEDKSLDSDCTDKSSIKMIAKIQANLNENTMIKSPKTPMDARTIDPMDVDAITRNVRKRSIIDIEKKFITQDSSHVQGVEISKSAKIPSTTNPFPNRSVFSPNKDTELFEFDNMLAVDDGFNHEEIMKPFTSYCDDFFFKEDSKEQGVQETLNLVDRLRMQLNTKKQPIENSAQDDAAMNDKVQGDEDVPITLNVEKSEQDVLGSKSPVLNVEDEKECPSDIQTTNHFSDTSECLDVTQDAVSDNKEATIPTNSKEKWVDLTQNDSPLALTDEVKYGLTEDVKDLATVQSIKSVSEIGDTISLSKQSDDSQSLSVVDHSMHSNDQELTQDNQTYDNNNSMIHSDCATISSPYIGRGESKITTRRSSASSTNSEGSICSQKTDVKSHLNCESLQGTLIPEIDAYPLPAYSCRVEPTMPLNQYTTYPPDSSPFLSTMATLPLFGPGPCASSQLTLPSPASGIYGSGLPYSASPLIPPLTKPAFTCAAFTSSSQNIALTTAMIASPIPKPLDSPRDDVDISGSDKLSIHVASSPSISVDSYNESSNTRALNKLSNDSDETVMSLTSLDTKSSPKPTTKSTKFSSKSPGKSPGISPRQSDTSKGTKRSNNKNNRSQRGRGRSKSRGQGNQSGEFSGNSIQSKLVGTVYDFNEEMANDGVDLKALRERCKSLDTKDDRKSEHSYKDSSQSPRAVSPHAVNKKSTPEQKEIKPSTPETTEDPQSPLGKNNADRGPGFTQVQPVLPGPVDMRTYNPFDNPAPTTGDAYHSHLLAFASGTADQHLVDFDEEMEKKLHSALMASKPKPGTPAAAAAAQEIVEPPKETFIPHLPKVSLSDSRNQLKVKIKGPFLDANYSTSSVQRVAPQPPPPAHDSNTTVFNISNSTTSFMTGSTNLRRMRKKELLRQYWTQDMNMDDPTNISNVGIAPPPAAPQPMLRAVITIPKAVASMTSIPTREDYKIIDTPVEKKKRKTTSGLSRELRHLEVSMNDDADPSDDVKLSNFAGSSAQAHKRRGRVSTKPNQTSTTPPAAPKLKIKFGSNIVPQVNEEPSGIQFRPPKKRLQSIPKPSLEDLKRESMKYRRLVMANFEEDEKASTHKHKPSKTEKRKKKKDKKSGKEKLQVINTESESATKLIIKKIKIKCPKPAKGKPVTSEGGSIAGAVAAAPEPPVDPLDYDPTKPDPLAFDSPLSSECASTLRRIRTDKVTPIRLKRSPQGSGYVMEAGADLAQTSASLASTASSASTASTSASVSFAVNKHCEVR
ncbi:jg6489 [Pararge aegeria aegeria]|uniref:Jg6489 protein n=1 Tax=Pararge aegeria aegeria TaxID=348720 RepID=A0A8S4QRN2_9NEOP|nr:jg6489 [Pararge aegeria aegeria]